MEGLFFFVRMASFKVFVVSRAVGGLYCFALVNFGYCLVLFGVYLCFLFWAVDGCLFPCFTLVVMLHCDLGFRFA